MSIDIASLPAQVQTLLEQRAQHVETVARIDFTLANVNAALGISAAPTPVVKVIPAAAVKATAVKAVSSPAAAGLKKRGRRTKFAISGSELVLAFVKSKQNPTTQEIKKQWISEGRGGGVDNTLSILTKDKKLKRTPLGKGIRGSRYSIA